MKNNDPHKFERIASFLHDEEMDDELNASEITVEDQDFIATKKVFELKEQVSHLGKLSQ